MNHTFKDFNCFKNNNGWALSASNVLTAQSIMYLGLLLRILVSVWNGFFGPSYGAERDAINTFHRMAVNYAHNPESYGFGDMSIYSYLLGMFYRMTTDSLFLGSLLSCIAWLISASVLMDIMGLLSFKESNKFKAMLVYALLPSSILFTSITLKEAYQLLFVNVAIYSVLKIFLAKSDKYWLLLLCAVISASLLHPVLYVFGLFMVIATLVLYLFRDGGKILPIKIILIAISIILVSFYGVRYGYIFNIGSAPASIVESAPVSASESAPVSASESAPVSASESAPVSAIKSAPIPAMLNGLATAIESYQRGGLSYLKDGRAFYKTSVEINGISGLILFIPASLFQYLFEPMPWHISAVVDFEAVFENILRAWLIWIALVGFRNLPKHIRIPIIFIFLSYIAIETIWSLGTINWGTAIRHHIPGMGLLAITAFASAGRRLTKSPDLKTIEGFGDEWTRFDQSSLSAQEQIAIFESYFSIFPWHALPVNSEGFDLGCGSGRWAKLVAPRVGRLHCIDPSIALDVARKNLAQFQNCEFHSATAGSIPLKCESMDFGYSLGVLHHIPDTQAALESCVKKLKPGSPFLVYLYYAFDNKPWWFRNIWRLSNILRVIISRFPYKLRYLFSQILAFLVYLPFAKMALMLEKSGVDVSNFPLSAYRHRSFYTMRTDALDRFGTRIEQRFTREEIETMMERAGLERIEFSTSIPFWCAVGYRKVRDSL